MSILKTPKCWWLTNSEPLLTTINHSYRLLSSTDQPLTPINHMIPHRFFPDITAASPEGRIQAHPGASQAPSFATKNCGSITVPGGVLGQWQLKLTKTHSKNSGPSRYRNRNRLYSWDMTRLYIYMYGESLMIHQVSDVMKWGVDMWVMCGYLPFHSPSL